MTEDGSVLFVQTATGGSFVPNPAGGTPESDGTPTPGGGADYLLTLEGHPGGTVYFSDRPERVFGEAPTQAFLDGLGFAPANPPNAALVAQTEAGEDVVVLELLNPTYDEATATVTYGANILAEYAGEGLAHVAARQQDDMLPEQFGRASLFIDDCSDADPLDCYASCTHSVGNLGRRGMCWSWGDIKCEPCSGSWGGTGKECDSQFTACNGKCFTDYDGNCGIGP